tara:strand:+ start:155 stop:532 length:378 start_codon:yes stop_codon:yes gene_type:complete
MSEEDQLNIFNEPLEACSFDPVTGFFRSGCCETSEQDTGSHTVCAIMTEEFLKFSKSKGNDLSTPVPAFDFPGLNSGDRWCLCAARWLEAYEAGSAPSIIARATHRRALEIIPMEAMKEFSLDIL